MSSHAIQLNITAQTKRTLEARETLKIESGPLPIEKPADSYAATFRAMRVGQWVFCKREKTSASAYYLNKCECRGKRMLFVTKRGEYKGVRGTFVIRKA
jgi:hypothetical protein